MENESPLGRGKGRQALGWVVEQGTDPPRRNATAVAAVKASQAFTPSEEGIHHRSSRSHVSQAH